MKEFLTFAVFTTVLNVILCQPYEVSDEFISSINEKATTWTARKYFQDYTLGQLEGLTGLIYDNSTKLPTVVHEVKDIPDSFDSREVWPECESIRTIRNQGVCGSCWAFATVEVMSDRLCIFTAGAKQFVFSPEELISCCGECGNCGGGSMDKAFAFWVNHGIPSGGDQDSNLGCRPYTAANDGHNPECNERCVGGYGKDWQSDIRHGTAAFSVTNTVEQMQHEIVINGPLVVGMRVFEDFFHYGGGVYQQTSGDFKGLHAVKIIGWGNDNGTPFWTVANSWGNGWGEGGYFRILRGSNHVGIEDDPVAANPNTDE